MTSLFFKDRLLLEAVAILEVGLVCLLLNNFHNFNHLNKLNESLSLGDNDSSFKDLHRSIIGMIESGIFGM